MAIAIALIVLLLASVLFHFLSPWQLTELASNWGSIDSTISISFWVTGFVFVAVNLFMVYAIIRYRYNKNRRSLYEPENKKLELWLTLITTVGIAALLAPGLASWDQFVNVPDDAHEVEVVGQQWHWTYRFPGDDGEFGAVDTGLIDDDNPFGMNPDDPSGRDDILVNSPRVLLPVDQPVKLLLRSKDVIHNFMVPEFRAKMDLVPGQMSYFWIEPERTGSFDVVCAELCGIAHFAMRGHLKVVDESDFRSWLADQPTWEEMSSREPGDPETGEQLYATCVSCHGPQGQGSQQQNAPKLAGLEPWYMIRQLEKFKSGARGGNSEDTFGQQMRPFANTLQGRSAMADVAAYIDTLPDEPAEATISGDAARGEKLYRTCAGCHGPEGQGRYTMNAPRLAGINDWYLSRQLDNFKQEIRGRHEDDLYGTQMAEMAKMLTDDQAVRDVIAYINTLPATPQNDVDEGATGRSE